MIEAIILAGGFGTRLQSVVKDVPKPMADIQGRPFLSYIMDFLAHQGVQKVLLSVGYRHEVIERHFGTSYGRLDIEYIIEHEPLGTGGAIREALSHAQEENVIILNGDTFFAIDVKAMFEFHCRSNADITIALKPLQNSERYGTVVMGQNQRIIGFREKSAQASGYINGGVYIVKRTIRGQVQEAARTFSFEEFLQKKITKMAAYAFVSEDFFIDIGIPVDYKKAQEMLVSALKERNV